MLTRLTRIAVIMTVILLSACGFHPQGNMQLAAPLHKMYLQTTHPYGWLARYLESYLKMSSVQLTSSADDADTILHISQDDETQELTGISGTQQTQQYNIHVTVTFEVLARDGHTLVAPQTLSEARAITIQSNQILGSSNEASLYYQQMRRSLAYSIMNRLSSRSVTKEIQTNSMPTAKKKAS